MGWRGGAEFLCSLLQHTTLLVSSHVHQPGSSSNPILLGTYGGFISERNDWPMVINSAPAHLPQQSGGTKSSNHKVSSPGNQPPSLDVFQKSLINITKALITGNYMGWGALCQV